MNEIKNFKIVLDTNILIYYFEDGLQNTTKKLIDTLSSNGNRITCSAVSGFELLRNRQEHEDSERYINLINSIYKIPIDSPALMNASTLYYLYKKAGKISEPDTPPGQLIDRKDRLTGDLIVGGTVVSYNNHLLLTANKKDFPDEYWKTISEDEIGDAPNKIKIYLLEPRMDEILKNIEKPLADPNIHPKRENLYEYRG